MEFRFLDNYETSVDVRKAELIKKNKYGAAAEITDFAILLGGYGGRTESNRLFSNSTIRSGHYYTDGNRNGNVWVINAQGNGYWQNPTARQGIGIRPATSYSSNVNDFRVTASVGGLNEATYGELPQTVIVEEEALTLETAFNNGELVETGRSYTADSASFASDDDFIPRQLVEYEYNGEPYVRVVADDSTVYGYKLSDGRDVKKGQYYWVKVEPIVWLVDKKNNVVLSKKIVLAGIPFNDENGAELNYRTQFEDTTIGKFMNRTFAREIIAPRTYEKVTEKQEVEKNTQDKSENAQKVKNVNPYNFDFSNTSKEDMIRGAIESGVPVFLHGDPIEEKAARVKQFDPDCEIVYMPNANLESFGGKPAGILVGEENDIPPTWYTNVLQKCENDPDRLHVVYLDGLTAASKEVQEMAIDVMLEGEVNGKWKLPANARIVAAGGLDDPLYDGFAHVNIETDTDHWLKWATTNDIHPAIVSYVTYKSCSGEDVLNTPYTGEKPNANPRKWEFASKVLTKTNQPDMLKSLIGEDLTTDFKAFVQQPLITVDDVVMGNYSSDDLEMTDSKKFATAASLATVDEENFATVRDFMKKVGPEPEATFEAIWAHGDEKRLEKLADAKINDTLQQDVGGKHR